MESINDEAALMAIELHRDCLVVIPLAGRGTLLAPRRRKLPLQTLLDAARHELSRRHLALKEAPLALIVRLE